MMISSHRIIYSPSSLLYTKMMFDFGIYRKISKKRKIKLQRRGEHVEWCSDLNTYYWEPSWCCPNPFTQDGQPWLTAREIKSKAQSIIGSRIRKNIDDQILNMLRFDSATSDF